MMSMDDLIALSKGRWFIPILAQVHADGGSREAVLRNRLGMSRTMTKRSLDRMVEDGWLQRNSGHGHPLRPEYLVASNSHAIAIACEAVIVERRRLDLARGGEGKWHLPLLATLVQGASRFSEIEMLLEPVTPRALSGTIKNAVTIGHVERRIDTGFPPAATYRLEDRCRGLAEAALEIAAA